MTSNFTVSGSYTTHVKNITINPFEVIQRIRSEVLIKLKPEDVKGYDDWYIDKDGIIWGVTEMHGRGSDIEDKIRFADDELLKAYRAFQTVLSHMRDLYK